MTGGIKACVIFISSIIGKRMLRSNCCFLICAGLLIVIRAISATDDVTILIQAAGYQCEVHRVVTEDGHFLLMHRILPKNKPAVQKNGPVFMMHTMFGSSADFVISGAGVALGLFKFLMFF